MSEWKLNFDEEQIGRIDDRLENLLANTKAVAVLFASSAGQPVGHVGTLSDQDRIALATLSAGSLAATVAIAKLLGQAGAFEQVLFEGKKHSVHSSTVGEDFLLVIAFDSRTKLGLVRLMAQEAAKDLLEIVRDARESAVDHSVRDLIDREFGDSLADELDTMFP